MENLIPVAAVIIAAMSLIATQLWAMRTARTNYVEALERRVTNLEELYKNCESEKSDLRAELISVYRQQAKATGTA